MQFSRFYSKLIYVLPCKVLQNFNLKGKEMGRKKPHVIFHLGNPVFEMPAAYSSDLCWRIIELLRS